MILVDPPILLFVGYQAFSDRVVTSVCRAWPIFTVFPDLTFEDEAKAAAVDALDLEWMSKEVAWLERQLGGSNGQSQRAVQKLGDACFRLLHFYREFSSENDGRVFPWSGKAVIPHRKVHLVVHIRSCCVTRFPCAMCGRVANPLRRSILTMSMGYALSQIAYFIVV